MPSCVEHAWRGRGRCPSCVSLWEADVEACGCTWRIPDDAKAEDMRGLRCVLKDGHGDPLHVVGATGSGYAMLWSVDEGKRIATPMARARLDRSESPLSYAGLSAMAAIVLETRRENAADD
jgi:hypothetical protein